MTFSDVGSINPTRGVWILRAWYLPGRQNSELIPLMEKNTTWDAPKRSWYWYFPPTFFGHPNILSLCRMGPPSTGSVACAGVLSHKFHINPRHPIFYISWGFHGVCSRHMFLGDHTIPYPARPSVLPFLEINFSTKLRSRRLWSSWEGLVNQATL